MSTEGSRSTISADTMLYKYGSVPHDTHTPTQERNRAAALEGVAHGITLPNEEDVHMGTPGCQRCEVIPQPIMDAGILHFQLPHTHTLGKVLTFLADGPWPHHEHDGIVSVEVPAHGLAPLLSPVLDLLSQPEQRDIRVRFQATGAAGNPFEINALPAFVARVRSAWLLDILRYKRIHAVFQPIVHASTATAAAKLAVYGYECLMRGEFNGQTVAPGPMLDLARSAQLLFQLDLAARRAALLAAAEQGVQEKIFVNFTPNSIYEPRLCLDSTVRLVDELGLAHSQVVFEIIETERLPSMPFLKRIVAYYREHGFKVALDDVGAGFSSLGLLLELKPDYVKLDMSLLRQVDQDPGKALIARKLLETARELGLHTIAEGIETPGELAWVQAQGADFVQGYLFARPAAVPPLR